MSKCIAERESKYGYMSSSSRLECGAPQTFLQSLIAHAVFILLPVAPNYKVACTSPLLLNNGTFGASGT